MPQPQARDVRFTDSYIEDRSGGLKSPDVGDKRKAWGACGWGGHNYGVQKFRSGDGRLGDAELLCVTAVIMSALYLSQPIKSLCGADAHCIETLRSPLACAPEEVPVDQDSARPRIVDVKGALTW